jgi:hypothetical protein
MQSMLEPELTKLAGKLAFPDVEPYVLHVWSIPVDLIRLQLDDPQIDFSRQRISAVIRRRPTHTLLARLPTALVSDSKIPLGSGAIGQVLFDQKSRVPVDYAKIFPHGKFRLRDALRAGMLLTPRQLRELLKHYSFADHYAVPSPHNEDLAIACLTVSARETRQLSLEEKFAVLLAVGEHLGSLGLEIWTAIESERV